MSNAVIELNALNAKDLSEEFVQRIPPCPSHFSGRGIVISGGGAKYFTNAWVGINMLRKLGCRLPIQVWYLGPGEMDDQMKALLHELDAEPVDAYQVRKRHPARILKGWELKPYAMIWSPFREVLFLDADNVPLVDPESLFDSPQFRETGAIFWPDFTNMEESREIWRITGVAYRDEPEFETGQVLVDKVRCWQELQLSMWYNEHSDFFYKYLHGDKDTFRFAWHKLNRRFSMTPHRLHPLRFTMCQHDFQGMRIFQHRNMDKWRLDGSNEEVEGFVHEQTCREILQQLRERWSGRVGAVREDIPGAYTGREAEIADSLTSRLWEYQRLGYDQRPMSFKAGGEIGIGKGGMEVAWLLRREGDEVALEIYSEQQLSMVLYQQSDGYWAGNWLHFEKMAVNLMPLAMPGELQGGRLVWDRFAEKLLTEAEPMSQNTRGLDNLGFGWLYYGLVRNLRPDFVVAIGSARGFMPFCAARGLQDNGKGKVIFIDPSYEGSGDPAWEGRGHWSEAEDVARWIERFGLNGWVTHLKMTSAEAAPKVREMTQGGVTGLVIIDGAHTYENSLEDFDLYSPLIQNGFALFHDSINPSCEVHRTIQELRVRGHSAVTLHYSAGLTLVEVSHPPKVEDKWTYLTKPSNRGQKMLPLLGRIVQPGDQVFDAYCGFSPLPPLLRDVSIFGFDRDAEVIAKLCELYPEHTWRQIEERYLVHASLPEKVDVLVALGLNYGYVSWDACLVVPNLRFLIRYYRPRACLFGAAADYHDAEILDELRTVLEKEGYGTEFEVIETDLEIYHRRRLLLGLRK